MLTALNWLPYRYIKSVMSETTVAPVIVLFQEIWIALRWLALDVTGVAGLLIV